MLDDREVTGKMNPAMNICRISCSRASRWWWPATPGRVRARGWSSGQT